VILQIIILILFPKKIGYPEDICKKLTSKNNGSTNSSNISANVTDINFDIDNTQSENNKSRISSNTKVIQVQIHIICHILVIKMMTHRIYLLIQLRMHVNLR
jgi:hypothetical protein